MITRLLNRQHTRILKTKHNHIHKQDHGLIAWKTSCTRRTSTSNHLSGGLGERCGVGGKPHLGMQLFHALTTWKPSQLAYV